MGMISPTTISCVHREGNKALVALALRDKADVDSHNKQVHP